MRCFVVSLALLALCATGRALVVKEFSPLSYRFEVRHIPGGKTVSEVQKSAKALHVFPGGFFADKTIQGKKILHGIDLTIERQQVVVPNHFNRRVLAFYKDKVEIVRNYRVLQSWGMPDYALAGVQVPPFPERKTARQFWATKRDKTFYVRMQGTRWDCQRLSKAWGFEKIVHMDGGSTLDPATRTPSFVLVYRR